MKRHLRNFLERRTPLAAALYRALRDQLAAARIAPRRAAEGFLLVGSDAVLSNAFEPDERRIAQRLMPQCDVFVDVGANVGLYTCLARAAGKHVLAIEQHRMNVQLLYRRIEANRWDDV